MANQCIVGMCHYENKHDGLCYMHDQWAQQGSIAKKDYVLLEVDDNYVCNLTEGCDLGEPALWLLWHGEGYACDGCFRRHIFFRNPLNKEIDIKS